MVGALRSPARPLIPIDVGLPSVKNAGGIVTGTARHGPVGRQTAVEKEFLAERDLLGRLRVVRRDRLAGQLGGEANLVERFGLGQRTRFGNGTCFAGG